MEKNIFELVADLLKTEIKYTSEDGKLLKVSIYSNVMTMDEKLLSLLLSDEINRLLAPKVFTNAKKYAKEGVEENITFNENDNLIIKGNNLIAFSSLMKRYEGKVKCIYIEKKIKDWIHKTTLYITQCA